MKKSINLVSGKKRVDNFLKKLSVGTMGAFFFMVVLSLGLIGYRLVLKGTFDELDQKEQRLNSQLISQQDKKDKVVEMKSRLSEISKIISKRVPTTARIDTVSSLLPINSEVTTLSGNEEEIQVTLESESLGSLNDLIELKIEEIATDKKKAIKRVDMSSFGLNPKTLKYKISLNIEFI